LDETYLEINIGFAEEATDCASGWESKLRGVNIKYLGGVVEN
jgi:hypothetical protein